ncbi:uncharacterized protein DS421_6g177640 [Arachis hypogaea]|nr:uncharacterized protein DS421_6g177640 [Arachis hypogaea]
MVQPWAIGRGEQVGCSSQQLLYEAKWEGYMSPLQLDQLLNNPLNSAGGNYGAKSFDYSFPSSFDMYLSNKSDSEMLLNGPYSMPLIGRPTFFPTITFNLLHYFKGVRGWKNYKIIFRNFKIEISYFHVWFKV